MTTEAGAAASKVPRTTPGARGSAGQRRNFHATLLLSEGVPRLLGGDEMGRTQCGNNNAYCQDNAELDRPAARDAEWDLVECMARLCRFRLTHPGLRRRCFLERDIAWPRPTASRSATGLGSAVRPRGEGCPPVSGRLILTVIVWWERVTSTARTV